MDIKNNKNNINKKYQQYQYHKVVNKYQSQKVMYLINLVIKVYFKKDHLKIKALF